MVSYCCDFIVGIVVIDVVLVVFYYCEMHYVVVVVAVGVLLCYGLLL